MEHLYTTPKEKERHIARAKENCTDDIIPENFEYFMKNGSLKPEVCYVLSPTKNCREYYFICDERVTKEVKKALKENRLITDEDWLQKFYNEEKKKYDFNGAFEADTLEDFIKTAIKEERTFCFD